MKWIRYGMAGAVIGTVFLRALLDYLRITIGIQWYVEDMNINTVAILLIGGVLFSAFVTYGVFWAMAVLQGDE